MHLVPRSPDSPSIQEVIAVGHAAMIAPVSLQDEDAIFPSHMGPEYVGFDHITWYVGNAKQAASFYITRMGFEHIAYRGPETGSRCITSYVVSNGAAVFVLTSPNRPPLEGNTAGDETISAEEKALLAEIQTHLVKHGDGIKDVAFRISGDIEAVWQRAVDNGATSVSPPRTIAVDGHGSIALATISAYGDTVHSLVNRQEYDGPFLPGYGAVVEDDPISALLPKIDFIEIDHCVGNQPWNGVDSVVR